MPGLKGNAGTDSTAGNDTVNGLIDLTQVGGSLVVGSNTTFNGFDVINGGAGVNTFKLAVSGDNSGNYDVSLANIEKIQVVEINNTSTGGSKITVDASTNADVTDLKVTKSTSDIELTGSDAQNITTAGTAGAVTIEGGKNIVVNDATADNAITVSTGTATGNAVGTITVTDTKQGTGDITVDGGTTVNVTATVASTATDVTTGGDIIIGGAAAATGAVTVVQNLTSTGVAETKGSVVTVTGGSTVNVTVNATSTATAAGSDDDITIGTTTVTGDSKTTDVTVTQNASVTTFTTPTVAAVADKTVVTFKAMTAGQTATVNGLTFTASTALTAEKVAAAFANLGTADTQDKGGPTANGIYSGASSTAAFTSGAASGATVTFTAAAVVGDNLALGGTAAPTKTSFTAGSGVSGGATTSNTVTLGDVVVKDHATEEAIKTITLNGFKDATLGSGGSLDALTTLNLANSAGDTTLTSTSKTLAVTLNDIDGGDVNLGANVETLTLTTTGAASDIDLTATGVKSLTIDAGVGLDLQAASDYDDVLETVTIKGAGAVDLGVAIASTALKSFSAADNKGGVTVSVSAKTADVHSTFTKYVLSQGNDNVTLTDVAVNKAIELGAGDDTITLATGVRIGDITATIDAGVGDADTLVLAADDAESLSGANTFNAKISGFERLSIGAAASQEVVDLDNIDGISYVTLGTAAGTAQVVTLTDAAAKNGDTTKYEAGDVITITINGTAIQYTVVAGDVDADDAGLNNNIVLAIAANPTLNALVTAVATDKDVITLTSKAAGVPIAATMVITTDTSGDGVDTITPADTTLNAYGITLDNLANNGTVVLTGAGSVLVNVKDAGASGHDSDVLKLIANSVTSGGNINLGYLEANDVESIEITAQGSFTPAGVAQNKQILALAADTATSVKVDGAGNLDLALFYTSNQVELVDASAKTAGALNFTANFADLVVKGGSGADSLTANANGVKLYGNGGSDTLTVNMGFDSVKLFGGDGIDTFVINGGSTTDSVYTVIDSVGSGDVIKLSSGSAGTTAATSFEATKVELSTGATVSTQALIEKALGNLSANEIGWFNYTDAGQTYTFLVLDGAGSASTTYQANDDVVVMLVGNYDLSTASYNATSNTLELA